MKKVLVIFICLVVLFSAKITLAEEVTLCDSLAYAAEEIMFMRQENRDVTKIIESFRKNYRQEDFEILCGLLLSRYFVVCCLWHTKNLVMLQKKRKGMLLSISKTEYIFGV